MITRTLDSSPFMTIIPKRFMSYLLLSLQLKRHKDDKIHSEKTSEQNEKNNSEIEIIPKSNRFTTPIIIDIGYFEKTISEIEELQRLLVKYRNEIQVTIEKFSRYFNKYITYLAERNFINKNNIPNLELEKYYLNLKEREAQLIQLEIDSSLTVKAIFYFIGNYNLNYDSYSLPFVLHPARESGLIEKCDIVVSDKVDETIHYSDQLNYYQVRNSFIQTILFINRHNDYKKTISPYFFFGAKVPKASESQGIENSIESMKFY